MDKSGIVQKTVSRAVFEQKIYRSKNLCFEMVAMATSCKIFVWKIDFLSEMCRKAMSYELSAH